MFHTLGLIQFQLFMTISKFYMKFLILYVSFVTTAASAL